MNRVKVFYNPKMVFYEPESFSPSCYKPKLVVEDWLKQGFPIELVESGAASFAQLCLAHDPAYVEGILSCNVPNGFGSKRPETAAALPYVIGSIIEALHDAYETKESNFAPVSGLHHSSFASGGSFCSFSGMIIASEVLRQKFPDVHVGILDLDFHSAWQQQNIIDDLKLDYIRHYSFGMHSKFGEDPEGFIETLPLLIADQFYGCDVVVTQLAADMALPKQSDLGGILNDSQMRERDFIVFSILRDMDIPCTTVLGGGYDRDDDGGISPVIRHHRETVKTFLQVHDIFGAASKARVCRP